MNYFIAKRKVEKKAKNKKYVKKANLIKCFIHILSIFIYILAKHLYKV